MCKVDSLENQIESLLPRIRKTIIGYVHNPGQVDDLTQEVVMKLLRTKTMPNRLDSWLLAVIRNAVIDFWRKEAKENQYRNNACTVNMTGIRYTDDDYQTRLCEPSVREEYTDWNIMPAIQTALGTLGKSTRQSLLLHMYGYGYDEIAAMTKASIGTVKSRLHYGKKRAKELLAEYR